MYKIIVSYKKGTTTIKTASQAEKKMLLNALINDLEIDAYIIEDHYSYRGTDSSESLVMNPVTCECEYEYSINIKCALSKEERKLLKAYMSDYTCDDIPAFSCAFEYLSGIEDFDFGKASYSNMSLAQFA